jgi:CHASE1-domain containing sensor protein
VATIRQGFGNALEALESTGQLFVAFGDVDRDQFHAFTGPLLQRYPYIQAFNFHRVVGHAELSAYLARVQQRFPHFTLAEMERGEKIPLRRKERYHLIDYLEPMRGNEAAFGLDVSPNAHLMQVVRTAMESGRPQSTGILKLAQGSGSRAGFLVVMPVYRYGAPLGNVEERRRAFVGDVAAVFRAGALIDISNSTIRLLPKRVKLPMMAKLSSAASRPYSIAVAPS